jgi:hypothetical protein
MPLSSGLARAVPSKPFGLPSLPPECPSPWGWSELSDNRQF